MHIKAIVLLIGCLICSLNACPSNCHECDAQGNMCFVCSPGFQLSVLTTCVDQNIVPNCNLYGHVNQCFACQPTFKLNPETQLCQKSNSACLRLDASDSEQKICQTCGFGTVLQDGVCVGAINCKIPQATCTACASGFNLVGGRCVDNTGNCKEQTNGICKVCKSGYKLIGFSCIRQKVNAYGCYIYDDAGICSFCKNGLNLYQGKCFSPNQLYQIQNGIIQISQILNTRTKQLSITTTETTTVTTLTADGNSDAGFDNFDNFGEQFTTITTVITPIPKKTYPIIPFCVTQIQDKCTECLFGYYLATDLNGNTIYSQCFQIPQNCQAPDRAKINLCLSCVNGYTLNKGNCLQTITSNTPNCLSYNLLTGICSACINNYVLTNGQCIFSQPNIPSTPLPPTTTTIMTTTTTTTGSTNPSGSNQQGGIFLISSNSTRDINCARYDRNVCAACSNRYYFGTGGLCVPVNPLCKDFLAINGGCTTCYAGYSLSGNQCIISRQIDSFCKQYNSVGVCNLCFNGYYYNKIKVLCQPLNPLCKSSNLTDGSCKSCFPGYRLVAETGLCSVAFQDPNCKKFDSQANRCIQCSANFYLNPSGKCIQVNPLCKTSDPFTGRCISCYPGYALTSGSTCTIAEQSTTDINCQTFVNNICTRCYSSYFLNSNKQCIILNPLCKSSNQSNGACLTCYPGYSVSGGNCTISAVIGGDPNCKKYDANNDCQECYPGYYISNRRCAKIQLNCKSFTPQRDGCTECYGGYSLIGNLCLLSKQAPNQNDDNNCIKSQGANCVSCASGFYLATSGICIQQNPHCRSIDRSNGACTSCYPGFALSGMTCIVERSLDIPHCFIVAGDKCQECINGYYVKNNVCSPVSILCSTYDLRNGYCTSCIPGYFLQDGQCIYPSFGLDPYCIRLTNSYCTQCNQRSVLINYRCEAIDIDCNQFDSVRSICTSCLRGKIPSGINCI